MAQGSRLRLAGIVVRLKETVGSQCQALRFDRPFCVPGTRAYGMLGLLAVMVWGGCVRTAPVRIPPQAPPEQTKSIDPEAHLKGVWESPGKNGRVKQLIFGPGGQLTFQGGLEFFNPGRWELDPDRRVLRITLPGADDEKLQIFQMYVGDGVKAFDRAQKRITYQFDDQTWALNVAGWPYTKAEEAAPN